MTTVQPTSSTTRIPNHRSPSEPMWTPTAESRPTDLTAQTIADPAPLGLAAFALTLFCLSVFNAKLLDNAALSAMVLPIALCYGGIVQFLAGMWEFRRGNTFGATMFTSFGAFWLSYAGYAKYIAPGLPPADDNQATGLFLLAWTIFGSYMLVASWRTSPAMFAVFVALAVTFVLLTWGAFAQNADLTRIGGWAGLATAAIAWYTSAAGVTGATFGRQILPIGTTED
jgi:succinate-acetate transporter protein